MKAVVLAAALATAFTVSAVSQAAADQTVGKVKSYDAATQELRLLGKKRAEFVYVVPADHEEPELKRGVRVRITWEPQDDKRVVSAIVAAPKKKKEQASAN